MIGFPPRYGRRRPFAASLYRLCREEGLGLRRRKPTRRRARISRAPRPTVSRPNEWWMIYFMSDALANSEKLRVLTVVDALRYPAVEMFPRLADVSWDRLATRSGCRAEGRYQSEICY